MNTLKYKLLKSIKDWRKGEWISMSDYIERTSKSRTTFQDFAERIDRKSWFSEPIEYCPICNKHSVSNNIHFCSCGWKKQNPNIEWIKIKDYLDKLCWDEKDIKAMYDYLI